MIPSSSCFCAIAPPSITASELAAVEFSSPPETPSRCASPCIAPKKSRIPKISLLTPTASSPSGPSATARFLVRSPAATSTLASAGVALPQTAAARAVPVGIATLYHRGTLRGGQALHNLGNLVVIGDVNPGAELVASGDIVVFGALRGVAHAGAQGDRSARVIALELAPTQLRIATLIAPSDSGTRARGPEHASIVDERIVVVPFAEADLRREHTS